MSSLGQTIFPSVEMKTIHISAQEVHEWASLAVDCEPGACFRVEATLKTFEYFISISSAIRSLQLQKALDPNSFER